MNRRRTRAVPQPPARPRGHRGQGPLRRSLAKAGVASDGPAFRWAQWTYGSSLGAGLPYSRVGEAAPTAALGAAAAIWGLGVVPMLCEERDGWWTIAVVMIVAATPVLFAGVALAAVTAF